MLVQWIKLLGSRSFPLPTLPPLTGDFKFYDLKLATTLPGIRSLIQARSGKRKWR